MWVRVNLYKFCLENCIPESPGALVEAIRGRFELVGRLSPQTLSSLRSACEALGGYPLSGKFVFSEPSRAEEFASEVSGMGIEVHTLRRHVEALASYLQTKKGSLIAALDAAETATPSTPIMVLDPLARRWRHTKLDEIDETGTAVLCDGPSFYVARYGRIVRVPKEEAYLFALLFLYREKGLTAMLDDGGSYVGVRLSDVGNLPDSVFYTLLRLQPTLRKGSPILLFHSADVDTLARAFRLAKLRLIIATGIVRLPHKLGVKEVEVISPHLASKEAGLLSEVFRALGHTVRYGDQYIEVELDGGPVRIYITSSGKFLPSYLSDGTRAVLIPLRYLLTPDEALYALKLVRTYGFSLISAEQWPRVLGKLCELAEGEPSGASKLAMEALLAGRSKPEVLTALASNPALVAVASRLIELAAQGASGTPLDRLPQGELIELWRKLRRGPRADSNCKGPTPGTPRTGG